MNKLKEIWDNLSLLKKIISIGVILLVVAGIVVAIVLSTNGYYANTMRLLRVEGTVNIEDSNGGTRPVIENIRFQSGDALSTGTDGLHQLVWMIRRS